MKLFQRHIRTPVTTLESVTRQRQEFLEEGVPEAGLYYHLRRAVPLIDAALRKIVRLTGDFTLETNDRRNQRALEQFVQTVPVGISGASLGQFTDSYLDSLLTCGNAVGEILIDDRTGTLYGLQNGRADRIRISQTAQGRGYSILTQEGLQKLAHPERIVFTALTPPPDSPYGISVLQGLPALSGVLLRIYECIGQNYDRMGNIRYAVTYHPGEDPADRSAAVERTKAIAREWQTGMRAAAHGEIRDFISTGDVQIQAIGAENPLTDTEVPVRQLLEQLLAKLSVPPFLLGLSWSSTERMSSQQADILTSELTYYRRLLEPMLCTVGRAFLRTIGSDGEITVNWNKINLQDETELALARLRNAQAAEIEQKLQGGNLS